MVNFSNNKFNESISESICNLTHLTVLNLANNSLVAQISDMGRYGLQVLDLANNKLSGVVPKSLHKFPKSDFVGNNVSIVYGNGEVPIVMPPKANLKTGRKIRILCFMVSPSFSIQINHMQLH